MANIYDMTDSWTDGSTLTSIKMNVIDTSSAADSKLLDLQVGGSSKLTVGKDGAITAVSAGSVIPFYYDSQGLFPSASTYHGALAHSHNDGAMYFAHSNAWNELASTTTFSNRNLIINGAMQVAQRGTTVSGGTGRDSYGLDRFVFEGTNSSFTAQVAHSHSQITDGNRNALKISTTGTAIFSAQVHQRIERGTFRHTIGQTVTFSCLVKRNSSNVTDGTFRMIASVNQNATFVLRDLPTSVSSHTVTEDFVSGVQNIPTDYTRYTASFIMPAGANTTDILEIGLSFINFTGAGATEDLFSITEMQLELGDTATPFEHRSYGEELALCQRYYIQTPSNTAQKRVFNHSASSKNLCISGDFPVTMRTAPSMTVYGDIGDTSQITLGTTAGMASTTYGFSAFEGVYAGGFVDMNYYIANAEL